MPVRFDFDVFVSYSAEDVEAATMLASRLRDDGLRVWFDRWNIQPGDLIGRRIDDGIERSRVLIFCMSASSYRAVWPQYETYTRRFSDPTNEDRRFVPVRLDDSPVPERLRGFRYASWLPAEREREYPMLLAVCRGEGDRPFIRQRVCMISSEFPPHVLGGLGIHVAQLTGSLAQFADIDLVLPYRSNRYGATPPGVTARMVVARGDAHYEDPLSWLHFAGYAYELVASYPKPDAVHCHDWVTVLAGIRCKRKLKVPLVFHVHLPNRSPLSSSIENLGLLYADLVTVNSQQMAAQLRDRFPGKEITVIPNGVDTSLFRPRPAGQPPARPYILFVGRMVEQKGVDHLLRAFVHVHRRFPECELWLVGDGEWKHAYEQLAKCLLIDKGIRFMGHLPKREELARLYQDALVVVVPSIFEPFGMTALEGMACGRPVVASRTGGLEEIIRPNETGVLVEPKDHLDLAQWVIRLLDDEKFRDRLGARAATEIHSESSPYQWSSIARRYAELYYKLSFQTIDHSHVPKGAPEYRDQIRSFACDIDPLLGRDWALFDWI